MEQMTIVLSKFESHDEETLKEKGILEENYKDE